MPSPDNLAIRRPGWRPHSGCRIRPEQGPLRYLFFLAPPSAYRAIVPAPHLQQPLHNRNQARELFHLSTRAMRSLRPRRPGRPVISAYVPGRSLRPLRNAPAPLPLRRLAPAALRWADSQNPSAFEKSFSLLRKLSELEARRLADPPTAHRCGDGLVGNIARE